MLGEMSRLFTARDWTAMRALYHPDARILTVTGGPEFLGADEIVLELERASEHSTYSVKPSGQVVLDEHAAIVTGRMRRPVTPRGFEDAGHVWLITIRDGLVYRQVIYQDTEEATAAYRSLGVALGIGEATEAKKSVRAPGRKGTQ